MDYDHNKKPSFMRDLAITALSLAVAAGVCALLRGLSDSETYVPLLFVLSVLVVSRLTDGYLWGIAAAFVSVLGVNYAFTFPYMEFNFTISGYPVTFVTMLAVALSTSTLTTHIKEHEKLKLETEREKMRANLLRSVSHDLRTPLTSISGSAAAVLDNPQLSDESRRELLEGVRQDADWLLRMVENLLSITRIGGSAGILKTPEPVEEVAGEAARKFRKRFPGVALTVSIPEDVLFVPMDAVLIEQVLSNLMENAVLHGGTVSHVWLSVESTPSTAVFSVRDDGAGISREAMPRLFSDYFDQTQSSAGHGEKRNMGIGLSVCMTIVKAHGGNLSACNMPDGGARFLFTLPLEYKEN